MKHNRNKDFKLNKIALLLFSFLIVTICGYSQSASKGFKTLSSPEKCWVIFHPFKAKRAYRLSLEAKHVSDSISKTNLLDKDGNGGQVDAFRHAYWMATLAQEIGKNSAKSLGKAHERGNHKQFKKGKLEDGTVPDKPSSDMDLFNNDFGITLYKNNKKASKEQFITLLVQHIQNGNLKILKKDTYGNYQDCEGNSIPKKELKGIWETSKCLIDSDQKTEI